MKQEFMVSILIIVLKIISTKNVYIYGKIENELNQIGIKIDMYRQEYRFTPAFAFIQAV